MKKIGIILIGALLVGQFGCKKCKSDDKGAFNFTNEDKLIIPYTGNEKLTFIDSIGDTMCFTGTGRIIKMEYRSQYQHGCPGDVWSVEVQYITFGVNSNNGFNISIEKTKGTYNRFAITGFFNSPIDFEFYFACSFKSSNFYCGGQNELTPMDSLTINNTKFYSVYVLPYDQSFNCDTTRLPYIYYTINKGIVGFQTTDNKFWNIE